MSRTWLAMAILGASVLGGATTLILEWSFFHKKPTTVPLVIPAPTETDLKAKQNPCADLYAYVCSITKSKDPTGEVRRESEGEVDVLRIYESIVRNGRSLTRDKIDEILVQRVYTPERLKMLRDLFEDVRENLLEFIDSQTFKALSSSDKLEIHSRIERVRLELPPPASVYADERALLTKNDVYYQRSPDGRIRIRIGGALFYTVNSRFNLAYTLAHELAHAIDPCELREAGVDIISYHGLSECFGAPMAEGSGECRPEGQLSEIFADWIATHVVVHLLMDVSKEYTKRQLKNAVVNSVRDLCRDEDVADDLSASVGYAASHPDESYRVNRIFAQHPQIRKILGCHDVQGPALPGVPVYCFWSVGTK